MNPFERFIAYIQEYLSVPAQVCVKCEGTTFTRGTHDQYGNDNKESIRITCSHCGYIWHIATADKVKDKENSKNT